MQKTWLKFGILIGCTYANFYNIRLEFEFYEIKKYADELKNILDKQLITC